MTSYKLNSEFVRFHDGFVVIAEFPHLETICKTICGVQTELATLNTGGFTTFANCICITWSVQSKKLLETATVLAMFGVILWGKKSVASMVLIYSTTVPYDKTNAPLKVVWVKILDEINNFPQHNIICQYHTICVKSWLQYIWPLTKQIHW